MRRILLSLTDEELRLLKTQAQAAGLSVSGYVRRALGLPARKSGAPAGNQNAKKP